MKIICDSCDQLASIEAKSLFPIFNIKIIYHKNSIKTTLTINSGMTELLNNLELTNFFILNILF